MNYQVIFDLHDVGFKPENLAAAGVGVLFVCIGIVFILFRRRMSAPRLIYRYIPFFFLILSVIWTLAASETLFSEYTQMHEALLAGRVSIVEGPVRDFKAMPYDGRSMEQFCVRAVCFKYSDYIASAGFNHTSSHGGPIREGLPVRVSYVGNTIVRLEVAAQSPHE